MGIRRVLTAAAVALAAAGTVGGTAAPAGATPGSDRVNLAEYEARIAADVEDYWRANFDEQGFAYRPAGLVLVPATSVLEVCGVLAGDPGRNPGAEPAFYCAAKRTVYLSAGWMHDEIYDRFGRFGTAVVIAHEFGHHIQQLSGVPAVPGKRLELQADCFAGTWTGDAYERGAIDDYDVAEGGLTLHYLGDYEMDAPDHHGTPQERADAYADGVSNGGPTDC
ncbi:MAG TPA: neutral zinc metallopeptidase [Sporichthya sp.]|nr:neutral zinc metallopeptidase [Sporichthya sp.]